MGEWVVGERGRVIRVTHFAGCDSIYGVRLGRFCRIVGRLYNILKFLHFF